jgi:hypothetical protein
MFVGDMGFYSIDPSGKAFPEAGGLNLPKNFHLSAETK